MNPGRTSWHLAALTLCLALSGPGCSVDRQERGPLSGLPIHMTAERGPDLTGTWRYTASFGGDACVAGHFPLADEGVLRIVQSGATLATELRDLCGTLVAAGAGSLGGDVVTLAYDQTVAVSGSCSLKVHEVQTGTLGDREESFGGSDVLRLSGLGDCGNGLPCETSGPFVAERCPPADCSLLTCP